jgi:hypothetical protein
VIGFLFARQRSGTGALGSVLDRHPDLKYVGEVLHPDDRANPVNFFSYVEDDHVRMSQYCDPNTRADLVESYFQWLEDRFHPRIPIVDVKYRSVHHWNGGWQGAIEPPWIVQYIREHKLPLIHLKRKNNLETYVSGRLAEENQVWHAASADEVKIHEIVVDIRQLSRVIVNTTEEVALMDSWLQGIKTLVVLEYAELFDAEGLANQDKMYLVQKLFQLEKPFEHLKPSFVKQAPRLVTDSITNLSLVERAFRNTDFAWMLQPPRG